MISKGPMGTAQTGCSLVWLGSVASAVINQLYGCVKAAIGFEYKQRSGFWFCLFGCGLQGQGLLIAVTKCLTEPF